MKTTMRYITILSIFVILLSPKLLAQLESPHPYPNVYDHTETFIYPGAVSLDVIFDQDTSTEKGCDYIYISGIYDKTPLRYSGKTLSGMTLNVKGDTVRIRLASDDSKTDYGYKILRIVPAYIKINLRDYPSDLYKNAEGLYNQALKDELYNLVKSHTSLGYDTARLRMFSEIDNENGQVQCVYTGRWVTTSGIPDPNDMNTEHTWPKSMGAENEPAKSDLFHLYPTDNETNSRRSNYPFGIVATIQWSKNGSVLGKDSTGQIVFSPRDVHKGNVARSMFYFSIRYKLSIPNDEESALKQWHIQDPVDDKERERNESIYSYQKKRNPFIDRPDFVNQIDDF